jgi:osmoprotectant transport system substrate-binding protein
MRRAGLAAALVLAVVVLVAGGCTSATERPPPEDPRRPIITVTSFDFPESETLAELYGQALRQQGYPVEVVARLGPREIVQPALEQGRVDLVLGYLGSTLNFLYEQRVATADPQATHAQLTQALTSRGISVLAFAKAEDRNGFVVTGDLARQRQLERISDLAPIARQLTFGGPPECPDRPLCLKGLQDVYGLQFARFEAMPSRTTTADALETGEIDLGMLETTNGNLADRDLVQLNDDRRLQPAENIAPMMRTEIAAAYGPRLVRVLNNLTAQLNTRDLIQMNQRVELEGAEPAAAAADWLLNHPVDR